jgi:hypothetical protein
MTNSALSELPMVVATKKREAKYSGYESSFACSGVAELLVIDPTLQEQHLQVGINLRSILPGRKSKCLG